mmetsp:Transcript_4952/g.21206  ORF Transcript_4952/g.21206 Transcript_4952/m.21206 type:complete len:211 (+) Transcript_4952:1667-2299(+)
MRPAATGTLRSAAGASRSARRDSTCGTAWPTGTTRRRESSAPQAPSSRSPEPASRPLTTTCRRRSWPSPPRCSASLCPQRTASSTTRPRRKPLSTTSATPRSPREHRLCRRAHGRAFKRTNQCSSFARPRLHPPHMHPPAWRRAAPWAAWEASLPSSRAPGARCATTHATHPCLAGRPRRANRWRDPRRCPRRPALQPLRRGSCPSDPRS